MIPDKEQFSQHQTELGKKLGVISKTGKYNGNTKLVPHLMEHKDYVIHYRNLQFIESLGVKITEVKEIVEFDQKDWDVSIYRVQHRATEARQERR